MKFKLSKFEKLLSEVICEVLIIIASVYLGIVLSKTTESPWWLTFLGFSCITIAILFRRKFLKD